MIAFLKEIPALISLIIKAVKLIKQAKRQGWEKEGIEIADKLEKADSDAKAKDLLRTLVRHSRRY